MRLTRNLLENYAAAGVVGVGLGGYIIDTPTAVVMLNLAIGCVLMHQAHNHIKNGTFNQIADKFIQTALALRLFTAGLALGVLFSNGG